ncbi:proline-rich protein 2-like [Anoplophora glabripennis]|uniref:proline-rich protein 2-like n=1 Tax=Anoplophora glabripennis TaxID=217634 RepID=UPI000C7655B1|nr:proline-rich protein 2-like [Anoplophora glabripennis]
MLPKTPHPLRNRLVRSSSHPSRALPGNPVNDDVSSDEEDEMPPPEAAEAEDQGLDDLHVHARPHAETKSLSQPPPAVGGPIKRPAQHFPGHLDIRRKRRPVRMVAISPPPTKRTQQPRPHERPGTSANPQQSQPAASRTTGAANIGQPPPPVPKTL